MGEYCVSILQHSQDYPRLPSVDYPETMALARRTIWRSLDEMLQNMSVILLYTYSLFIVCRTSRLSLPSSP